MKPSVLTRACSQHNPVERSYRPAIAAGPAPPGIVPARGRLTVAQGRADVGRQIRPGLIQINGIGRPTDDRTCALWAMHSSQPSTPLSLKMGVTSQVLKKRRLASEQLVTISSAELYVSGNRITDKRDERIAFGFMFYGPWTESEHLTMDDDRVAAIEYSFSPVDHDSEQPFCAQDLSAGWRARSSIS